MGYARALGICVNEEEMMGPHLNEVYRDHCENLPRDGEFANSRGIPQKATLNLGNPKPYITLS